jgi:hypothetical protein
MFNLLVKLKALAVKWDFKMTVFSSKPTELDFQFLNLNLTEIELIAAMLYNTILGSANSVYQHAALTLMQKIELFAVNPDFLEDAASNVNMCIKILDPQGNGIGILNKNNFEISV